MKKVNLLLVALTLLFSCSSDDSNNTNQGFSVNGSSYDTNYAYTTNSSSVFIFSSVDRNLDSFNENRGRFNLNFSGNNFEPGVYSVANGGINGVVEFDRDIIKENGTYTSSGETLAFTCCSESHSNNFQSGTATINSVGFNNEGRVSQINIDYSFNWDGIEINGSYSGQVVLDPQ